MRIQILVIILFFCAKTHSQSSFTQTDRESIIRLQVEVKEGFNRIEDRFDMMQKQIDQMNKQIDDTRKQIDDSRSASSTLTLSVFGILFAGIFALFGFIYWDRRTAVWGVEKEQKHILLELESHRTKILIYERIFKEVAAGKSLSPELLHQFGI